MKCIQCGSALAPGDRFCGECGLALTSALPPPAAPPVARLSSQPAAGVAGPVDRREIRQFVGHGDDVIRLAFSPDGARLFSADRSGVIHTWEVASGRSIAQVTPGRANAIDLSPDLGLALLGENGLRLVDLATGKVRSQLAHKQLGGLVEAVALLPDGRSALVSTHNNALRTLDLESGRELRRFEGHREHAEFLACSSDGSRALSGRFDPDPLDDVVLMWDLRSSQPVRAHPIPLASSIAFAPDGNQVIVGSLDSQVHLIDTHTGRLIRKYDAGGPNVWCVAFAAGGMFVSGGGTDDFDAQLTADLGGTDHDLRIWRVDHAELMGRLRGSTRNVSCLAVSRDAAFVAAGGADRTVRLWSLS